MLGKPLYTWQVVIASKAGSLITLLLATPIQIGRYRRFPCKFRKRNRQTERKTNRQTETERDTDKQTESTRASILIHMNKTA